MEAWAVYFEQPLPYEEVVCLQERLVAARLAGSIPDTVLFLEHDPVVTLGRRGRDNYLKLSREALAEKGVGLVQATRGGDVTYHAPGQLVMYPILKLGSHEADAHGYLFNLEEVAIRTARDFGVRTFRREGMNGAWSEQGKIAAIGFRLTRWISSHGMSFNVDMDLSGFGAIVPCGLEGESIASLGSILGDACPSLSQVRENMAHHFQEVCGRKLEMHSATGDLPAPLSSILRFSNCAA